MTPAAFNPLDTATFPLTLTVEMIAAIYHRPILGLKKACQKNRFLPAPYRTRPYLWRRCDVIRDVEGTRQLRRVS